MAISVLRTKSARTAYEQDAANVYMRVKFDTPQLDTAAKLMVGVFPQNCMPLGVTVRVNTTFNKDLIIGTSAAASAVASSLDIQSGVAGTYDVDRAYGTVVTTAADIPIYVQTATTGATVGEADIWLRYLPAV